MLNSRSFINTAAVAAIAAVATLAASCSESDAPRKITQTQEASVAPRSYKVGASSVERFGDPTADRGSDPHQQSLTPAPTPTKELAYDVPKGWVELPPTQMRQVNLEPAGNAESECYVSTLPAMARGVADNVNRWRKQFGQAEMDAASIAALPSQKLLTLDATLVELKGDYKPAVAMPGQPGVPTAPTKKDFGLVGLIVSLGDQMVFVKMVGPKAVVVAERANFDAFVKSLHGQPMSGSMDADGGGMAGDPHAGMGGDPHAVDPTLPPAGASEGLQFKAPAGWTRAADKPMRLATLVPPGTKQTECSIIVLPGDAGGLAGNLKRWRGQLGLPELTAAELAQLQRLPMLGSEGVWVDWRGRLDDSMNKRSIEKCRLVGALAIGLSNSVFLKLTGPESEVDDKVRDAFLELCATLKE